MFHRRASGRDSESDYDTYPDKKPNLHRSKYGIRRVSQLVKNRFFMTIAYIVSLFVMYQYFRLRSKGLDNKTKLELQQNPLYVIPEQQKDVPEVVETFQQYRYRADSILLPNAPYKHVKKNLDVRATQLIYLDAVRQKLERTRETSDNTPPMFDFHWMDWIDMGDLEPLIIEKPNCFVAGVLGSNIRTEWPDCIDARDKTLNKLNFYFDRAATQFESEYRLLLRAKTYLYTVAPIPKKIIFITGELAFVVKSKGVKSLKDNGMVQDFIQARLNSHKDISLTDEHIISLPITAAAVFEFISKELGRDLRDINTPPSQYADVVLADFDTLIKKIKKSKLASQAARDGRVHFHDVMIKGENHNFIDQYDWRFFQKTLDHQKHRAALHYTVRAWLSFASNLGFTSWLDEDSLVSWSLNGMILPWEKTVKFKLPSKDMAKLGTYNFSLIVDDPLEGHGAYLLDLGPYFMERARLNDPSKSPDTVDARFIDIRTGVYIELNGLMFSKATVPEEMIKEFGETSNGLEFVNSADGKFYSIQDLLPVKRTLFEGKLANVPGNALKLISHSHYDTISSKQYENYKYQDHLRLWISKSKCNYVPQEDLDIYKNGGSSFIGACHDINIWNEYNQTSDVSSFRNKEIGASEQLLIGVKNQFDPFYPDYWLMARIEKLHKEYGYPLP